MLDRTKHLPHLVGIAAVFEIIHQAKRVRPRGNLIQTHAQATKLAGELPVHFVAGGEDPVGAYGEGVCEAVRRFIGSGMKRVSVKLYPGCRHEIHNELNKEEVYKDISDWMDGII